MWFKLYVLNACLTSWRCSEVSSRWVTLNLQKKAAWKINYVHRDLPNKNKVNLSNVEIMNEPK